VRAGLLRRVAAASRGLSAGRMPASRGLALLGPAIRRRGGGVASAGAPKRHARLASAAYQSMCAPSGESHSTSGRLPPALEPPKKNSRRLSVGFARRMATSSRTNRTMSACSSTSRQSNQETSLSWHQALLLPRCVRRHSSHAAGDMLARENSGFSVDASVRITLIDRDVPSYFQSLEHLLRYCARPPFALERLSVRRGADGRIAKVRYVLPRHKAANWVGPGRGRKSTRPGANGVVELSPLEFLDRLADLVPPPRKHRHRYHGVFAPNHTLRRAVTALAIGNIGKQREAATGGLGGDRHGTGVCCDTTAKPRSHDTSRIAWAKLIARVGEEFPLECPGCGGDIRLIAFITDPGPIRKILTHLGEPLDPPPVSPARGPPTDWGELLQVHDDRTIFQASPVELPDIDIHSL